VVQTFVPDHYALAPVGSHDFEGFYREEIQHRETLGYPPFGGLTRIVVSSEEEEAAGEAAKSIAAEARRALPADESEAKRLEVLGPAPAPIAKLRGRFRFMLLLKGPDEALRRHLSEIVLAAAKRLPRAVQLALDADPVNML
jgi:primosomal protein N' (replication factor Y)